jgi:hypothetical protein
MPTFKDSVNRSWTIEITVIELKKVKERLGVDLAECGHGNNAIIDRLSMDDVFLVDILAVVLEEQYQKAGLTPEQFVTGLFGQGADDAVNCLVEAIANFLRPQRGRVLRAMWKKLTAGTDYAAEEMLGRVEDLDIEQMVKTKIAGILESLPTKSGD